MFMQNRRPIILAERGSRKSLPISWLSIGVISAAFLAGLGQSAYAALSLPFTVTMSEPVLVTGCPSNCPRIVLDVGGVARYADYVSGSGTTNLTFTYTPQVGDVDLDGISIASNTIDLNTSGTLKDLNGNTLSPLTFTTPNTSGIKVDYPSLSMDFVNNDYILNGTHYATLPSFLSAAGGTFTRASIGTYFDSAGVLQTATAGAARFDHDPATHAARGVLIEESRTNSIIKSDAFDNAPWSTTFGGVSATTISPNALLSPDGTISAEKIVEDSTSNFHAVGLTPSLAANTIYTISVFAKAGERSWLRIYTLDSTSSSAYANYNLTTGATEYVGGTGAYTAAPSIQNIGNGWYRCSLTFSLPATTIQTYFLMRAIGGATSSSYAGNGTSGLYLWGAQLEQGSFPTSYIPTTTAAAPRIADNFNVPVGTWFDGTKGAIMYGIDYTYATNPNAQGLSINAGGNQGYLIYKQAGTSLLYAFAGSSQQPLGSISSNTYLKTGMTYSTSTAKGALNGTLSATISPSGLVAPTALTIYNSNSYTGHIREFKYYPASITDTQLQLLTQ